MARSSGTVLEGHALPAKLVDLSSPPERLYVHGELPRAPMVAIVGTRHPTAEGMLFAHDLARDLAADGVAIGSGGAEGVDTAAHEGALAADGVTVVVAPSGFLRPFPPGNAELFRRVVRSGGAFVAAHCDEAPATRGSFFPRNELLVALADAVVVVEAGCQSGARNTAKRARQLGRPLFAVPGPPWNPKAVGCILELRLGALPLLGPADVLRTLRHRNLHPVSSPQAQLLLRSTAPDKNGGLFD